MTVYDCGANVGYFSVILASLVGPTGRVFAFEPSPNSVACLSAATAFNGYSHLKVIPKAVWSRTEVLRFVRGPQDKSLVSDHVDGVFGESSLADSYVEIPAISLDEFVYVERNPAPDFVKVDIEGSEGKAIAGACRLLAEHRASLLLEIHGEPGREVWEHLQQLKYVPKNIVTGEVPQTADEFAVWIRQYLAVPA